jgi:mannose-1-phosphate guanylyltransferase
LLHIVEQDPDAMVAVLPSDHYYSDEAAFTVALESAFHASGVHHDSVILLGARPSAPEIEFGWIRVGSQLGKHLFKVRGFEEKPALREAERLFREGALWNTFVMVGRAINFLWMSFCSLPELVSDLMRPSIVSEPSGVLRVSSALYSVIPTVDFCSKVLTPNAFRLLAMPLNQVEWHDLGREDRVIKVAQSHKDKQPGWIQAWNRAQASMN